MPTVQVTTSTKLNTDVKRDLATALSASIAKILYKPEAYVQVVVTDEAIIAFGGQIDLLSAFVRVYSIGDISATSCKQLSADFADIFQKVGMDPAKLYINFCPMSGANWGCNGTTFG